MREEKIHLARILLPFPVRVDMEQREQIRQLANELYERIVAGEDFVEICNKYSRGGGNDEKCGDIGWMKLDGMVPAFRKAIEGLDTGDVTPPFETGRGMYILMIVERKRSDVIPFEEVKDRIYNRLYDLEVQEVLYKLVQEIKERTPIERKL